MKNFGDAALFGMIVAMIFAGCSPSAQTVSPFAPSAPGWVMKSPTESNALYGVGIANLGENVILSRQRAEDAARQDIAKAVDMCVKNMMDRFMREHQDVINPASQTAVDFPQSVSRSVSQAARTGCEIHEVWQDRDNNIMYVLAMMTKTEIVKQVKNNVAAQREATFLEQKTGDALKAMDAALEGWDLTK